MPTLKTSTISKSRIKDDWEFQPSREQKKRKLYSADAVIDAYFQGRRDEKIENEEILFEKWQKNLNKAKKLSADFTDILENKKIKCKHVLLRPKKITEFESIFIVPKIDYISPKFEEIYKLSISKKTKGNSDTFHFSYTFIPYSQNINREKLSSDGYILEYVKKRQTKSCQS